MSVPYKNPISSVQISTPLSVSRTSVFGTNFSTLNVGGYMEVYNLSDLSLTLTASSYPSLIQLSANTIPIRFTKGNNTFLSPDYLTLNSDNISSGRRRLGMLVYVHETDKVYQYVIPNYDTLWNNLSGLTGFSSVTYSDYTTVVNTRSSAGQTFINSWTASTIEGVSGYTSTNANWRLFQTGSSSGGTVSGNYLPLSGGTVYGPTIFTSGLTATTISATTYLNLPLPVITGTTNYIPKFTSGTTLTNSLIFDSFSGTGINTTTPIAMLDIKLSATTDYILNLKDINDNDFFRINKSGGIFINTGATAYGAFSPTQTGIYINGDGSTSYGVFSNNRNIITFMQPLTSNSISGIQAATLNYGNVRSGLYFQNNASARPELFGTTVGGGVSIETFRVTEGGSFNIGGLNTDNSRFTIRNSRLSLGSKAFSILNSASTENVFINDNGSANFNGSLTARTISGNSLTLSSSASTINLDNPNQQQIRFFSGGTGTPQLSTYSQGVKIILKDNIDSSISTGYAIGVDAGSLWYGADLAGNGHDWYAGTRKLASLVGSSGFQLIGLGGPGTSAAMTISGTSALGSKGGTGYTDFLQVINNWSGATNPNKWFRVNSIGGFEILNSAYSSHIFSLTDTGILSVGGGNLATTSSSDGVTNYLMLGNNNTQIYDDGNTHIHSRGTTQSMWINTNGGQLNLLTQSPTATGSIGSGIAIATGTLNGYVTINTGRTITTSAAYGYLTTAGAGTYPGGSQSVSISLYANNRIWGQEIDAFSDERMKDIQGEITLEDGLKLVNNLKPIKYKWKEGDDKCIKAGYSAQQVIKSGFDHLVSIIPNEGLEETIDEDGFMSPKDTQFSMNYDQVTPYHGVVIKHLLEQIELLKEEIRELKNK